MRFSFRGNCLFIFLFAATLLATPPGYHEPWGNDCDLKAPAPTKEKKAPSLAVRMADSIIKFHQEVISPVDGPRSHYRPSSSQYMHLAMHRYGFGLGLPAFREAASAWMMTRFGVRVDPRHYHCRYQA